MNEPIEAYITGKLFFLTECCLWQVSSAWKLEFLSLTYFPQIFVKSRCRKANCQGYLKNSLLTGSKPLLNQLLQAGMFFSVFLCGFNVYIFFFFTTLNILFLYARIVEEVANMWKSVPNSHSEVTQIMIKSHLLSCLAMQFKFMVKMCWYYTF